MNSSDRRRADRFAELLEQAEYGRRPHRRDDQDAELVPLTDFARSLSAVDGPEPSDDLRTGLRAMLMAKIERDGVEPTSSALTGQTQVIRKVRGRGAARARAAVIAGVLAGVLASGVSLASTDSVPGDALYSVKRTSEQAQLALAGTDASRGRLHLEFAKSRLVESRQVRIDAFATTLSAMDAETTVGIRLILSAATHSRDVSLIDAVSVFVSQQRADLTELRADLSEPAIRSSLDLLVRAEARANLIRAAIAGGCAISGEDDLGPKPTC